MDLIDEIRALAAQIPKQMKHIEGNEEATKNALVMPFIKALGYNVFDPTEVKPEFTADVGIKKGEKVDYAILMDQKPIILIECKAAGSDLNKIDASQLYRYFSVTEARFGVLTNGIVYWFYSDLDKPNTMDKRPFLVFDLLDFDERIVGELKKFAKASYDEDDILATANDLKYRREIQNIISREIDQPSDEFVRFFAKQVYSGMLRQSVIDDFRGTTKAALKSFIKEQTQNTLKSALESTSTDEHPRVNEAGKKARELESQEPKEERQIVTTQEEIEGYFIVKSILRETIDAKRVTLRDTLSYCGVLLDDSNRKPICRLHFERSQKYLGVFDADKNEECIPIDNVDDIFKYADRLKTRAQLYDEGQ